MIMSTRIPSATTIRGFSVVRHAGSFVIACLDSMDAVWTWSESTGEWLARPLPYAHAGDPIVAQFPDAENTLDMLAASSVDGKLLLAAGGSEQEPAVWDLDTGELLWRTPINGAYLADVITAGGAFVTAQQYSEEVRLWSPDGTYTTLGEVAEVYCLGEARVGGRSLILAGGSETGVWDAETLANIATFTPEQGRVWSVTACELGERTAIFGGTENGELYAWALGEESSEPLYEPIAVSDDSLESVAAVTVAGRPLVVTQGENSLRLWDAAEGTENSHVDTREYDVTTMESTTVDGRRVLVTAGSDNILRIWDESDLA
ncbi:WD40 repeat domain-containing protein [Amycolatopsis sp. NPDC051045]|uniref:WD40 repeat domain-containing protein n=1 Tax=Amycolatopsis sp. NPDC051045 TaxID=3156922 RepID=UPI00343B9A80